MRYLLVCFALAACTNNGPMTPIGDDDVQPDAGPGSGSGADVLPQKGAWYYADSTAVHSSCNQAVQGENGEFSIDSVLAGSFHVIPNDGTTPFTCSLDHGAFDCPDRAWKMQSLQPAYDANLTVHGTAAGTFSSSVRAAGQQKATVTCTGSDCASLGLPCTFDVNFVIAARI
jgi:hypothetical protein